MTHRIQSLEDTTDLAAVVHALERPDCPLVPLDEGANALYDDMFAAYTDSPAGKHHMKQPPRFLAGWANAELDAELLLQLGTDTHAVEHMNVVHAWFQQVATADPQLFTPHQASLGRLAGRFHDVGENTDPTLASIAGVATPPGDIARGRKTQADRASEEHIRRAVYATILPEWPDDTIEAVEDIVSHRAKPSVPGKFDRYEHPHAVIFDALEVAHSIGSVGIAAAGARRLALQAGKGMSVNRTLADLSHEVSESSIKNLQRRAATFRFAGHIATQYAWLPVFHASRQIRALLAF